MVEGKLANSESRRFCLISVRTRKIDEEVSRALNVDGYQQVCIIGAGLCTRAWRLPKTSDQPVAYFEIDFPEIFDWKLAVLKESGAITPFNYHNVMADLSCVEWVDTLVGAGFNPSMPTLWLLEGFINYLKEDEANALLATLTNKLSAKGSRIVATSLTNSSRGNALHCFFPQNALGWFNSHGWQGEQTEIAVLAALYGRPLSSAEEESEDYYVVVAEWL
jgi:methyltransferase (TIGR00027 family)